VAYLKARVKQLEALVVAHMEYQVPLKVRAPMEPDVRPRPPKRAHNADRLNQEPGDMQMTEMAARKRAKGAAELEKAEASAAAQALAQEKRDAKAEAAVVALRGWLKCQPFCICGVDARPCSMSKLFRCVTCADIKQTQCRKAACKTAAAERETLLSTLAWDCDTSSTPPAR
jgi:hypothetical protein